MTYPIEWENTPIFDVDDRKITKLHDDKYRKICSRYPLTGYK